MPLFYAFILRSGYSFYALKPACDGSCCTGTLWAFQYTIAHILSHLSLSPISPPKVFPWSLKYPCWSQCRYLSHIPHSGFSSFCCVLLALLPSCSCTYIPLVPHPFPCPTSWNYFLWSPQSSLIFNHFFLFYTQNCFILFNTLAALFFFFDFFLAYFWPFFKDIPSFVIFLFSLIFPLWHWYLRVTNDLPFLTYRIFLAVLIFRFFISFCPCRSVCSCFLYTVTYLTCDLLYVSAVALLLFLLSSYCSYIVYCFYHLINRLVKLPVLELELSCLTFFRIRIQPKIFMFIRIPDLKRIWTQIRMQAQDMSCCE